MLAQAGQVQAWPAHGGLYGVAHRGRESKQPDAEQAHTLRAKDSWAPPAHAFWTHEFLRPLFSCLTIPQAPESAPALASAPAAPRTCIARALSSGGYMKDRPCKQSRAGENCCALPAPREQHGLVGEAREGARPSMGKRAAGGTSLRRDNPLDVPGVCKPEQGPPHAQSVRGTHTLCRWCQSRCPCHMGGAQAGVHAI